MSCSTKRVRVLGAVLAGGASRRFGSDKALALLDDKPLIDHVIARLAPQVDTLIIVGRDHAGAVSIPDRPGAGLGPLGGLCAALAYAEANDFSAVLTSGCDLPGLPADLREGLGRAPAFVARQPLLALWPAAFATRLMTYLAGGGRSLHGWVAATQATAVTMGPIANINTRNDLAAFSTCESFARNPSPPRRLEGQPLTGAISMATATYKNSSNDNGGVLLAGAVGFGLGLAASVGRKAAVQAITAAAGDWFDGLKAEHKLAMGIIEALEKTDGTETTKRAAMLLSLQHALGKHAIQEEDVIYCALRALGDVADADKLGAEHNSEVKQGLYDLEQIDKASPAWLARLRTMKTAIEAHVREEEDVVYPRLRAKLSPEENKKLTGRMNREGFKVA